MNPTLLATPIEISRELNDSRALLLIDLRPAEAFAAGHLPRSGSPGSLRLEHCRYRSGAAEGLLLDDRTPVRIAWCFRTTSRLWCTTTRRAFARRVLFGFSSSSVIRTSGCSTADTTRGCEQGWRRPGIGRAEGDRMDRHAHGRSARKLARRQDRIGKPDAVILDTRSDGEYCGVTVRAARGGAIPGAVHLEWTNNLRADGRSSLSAS